MAANQSTDYYALLQQLRQHGVREPHVLLPLCFVVAAGITVRRSLGTQLQAGHVTALPGTPARLLLYTLHLQAITRLLTEPLLLLHASSSINTQTSRLLISRGPRRNSLTFLQRWTHTVKLVSLPCREDGRLSCRTPFFYVASMHLLQLNEALTTLANVWHGRGLHGSTKRNTLRND